MRLKRAFLKTMIVNATLMILAGLFVFVFASPIVRILFGQGWEIAIPVVKLLSILGVTRGIASSTNSLLVAKAKQKYCAIVTFISATGLLVTITPLIVKFGIIGAGYAAIFGTLISVPFSIYFITKTLKN
jgi:PST family polysaccharide transporter